MAAAAASAWGAWGQVVASFPAPGSQAGGLAFDGTYVWYADYARYDSTIYKLTTTGSFAGQWRVNWGYAVGLAWDGTYLWSDALTARYVYKMNPANCSVISSFYGPSGRMMGMGCDGNYLYINDWQDRRVARVTFTGSLRQLIPVLAPSPSGVAIQGNYLWYNTRDFWTPANAKCIKAYKSNGSAVASFQCPDSQATDLGIQGNYLWVSGFTNKTIYKVDVTPPSAVAPSSLGKVFESNRFLGGIYAGL
jgi:DNA-binding beta-propeller fold protein YncE